METDASSRKRTAVGDLTDLGAALGLSVSSRKQADINPPDFMSPHQYVEEKAVASALLEPSPWRLEAFRFRDMDCWNPSVGGWHRFSSVKRAAGILPLAAGIASPE